MKIVLTCVLLGFVVFFRRYLHVRKPSKVKYLRSPKECRFMLSHMPLEARSNPNQRLVKAFHIDNALTTTNNTHRSQFVGRIKTLLRMDNLEGQAFADSAREVLGTTLRSTQFAVHRRIKLVSLVQGFVFCSMAKKFFASSSHLNLSSQSVQKTTKLINHVWIHSKKETPPPNFHLSQADLDQELQHIFGAGIMYNCARRDNPLNLILPAYEMLWRVVLRLGIEVLCLDRERRHLYEVVLFGFANSPTLENLDSQAFASGMTVRAIINEALRLYSTRRVYRQHSSARGESDDTSLVAADIEYLHRDAEVWGLNALDFNPSRWLDDGHVKGKNIQKQRGSFMPFGYGPFACPARHGAAHILIGVLVAVLVKGLGDRNVGVDEGASVASVFGERPLSQERDSYEDIVLVTR